MSVISGTMQAIMGSEASSNAADAQSDAARYAADIQMKMYQQSRKDLLPFMNLGLEYMKKAGDVYEAGPGSFEQSPYHDTMEHGIGEAANALARQSLVTGAGAGPTGKALMRYAVPYAAEQRGNWLNEWLTTKLNPALSLGSGGQQVAGMMSQNALQSGSNMGQTAMYGGEAAASGYLGRASAINAGMQNALQPVQQLGTMYAADKLGLLKYFGG